MHVKILMVLVLLFVRAQSIEVHFEVNGSGFFLKHPSRQTPVSPDLSNAYSSLLSSASKHSKTRFSEQDSLLSVDRFTVTQTNQPVAIRATYGPFSTKQTVPSRYIVPDTVELKGDHLYNTTAALIELQRNNLPLDISSHLVRSFIPRDSPVLRVLFHTGADPSGNRQGQRVCVLLHVSLESRTSLKGSCMPEGEDGVCLAEIVIPSNWWPQLPFPEKESHGKTHKKVPQPQIYVSYSIFEPPPRSPEYCAPKIQIQPLTPLAKVRLAQAQYPYKDIRIDEQLTILIPQHPLYAFSKIHVPVFLHQKIDENITLFVVRARVKSGIRITGATASCENWSISIEKENTKHTVARVTAFRKDRAVKNVSCLTESRVSEIFSWLLEFPNDSNENWDAGKIVWSVSYLYENSKSKSGSTDSNDFSPDESRKKISTKLELNKDDIQAILPISKNSELMNTAVLTGQQVAVAMKIFIVSQAGKVADVTLQSSCHSEDESVVKVSSSCSSVYVDGTEIRGSANASIIVKYATYNGIAKFTVWMPEFPLEVYIPDFRLSQIKGWKVADDQHLLISKQTMRRKRSNLGNQRIYDNVMTAERNTCRSRYQQSSVDVFARFSATDQNSGRVSYLITRRTGLRVTDLVQPLLRVADPKVAGLKGKILQGKSMGRTDVQVLSPVSGRVIGTKEIRVGSDKVSLTRLIVRVVSGLQLKITPDSSIDNGYIAETTVSRKLTAQYQEGLLDIDLEFSDGMKIPLREISDYDYTLVVESLDSEVVAFAPMLASHHPRVIAVGEGNGDLLRVTILPPEICRIRRSVSLSNSFKTGSSSLSSALASVQVDFDIVSSSNKPDSVQNDGILGKEGKHLHRNGDLADIIGIPLRDRNEPALQARQHRKIADVTFKGIHNRHITSLEIGMYVLLTTFCFAIVVFIISCVMYASKFRPLTVQSDSDPLSCTKVNFQISHKLRTLSYPIECTTNAHDWVWLGRSTLDRSPNDNFKESKIRIISNPISSFPNPNLTSKNITSFGIQSKEQFMKKNVRSHYYRPPVPAHRNIDSALQKYDEQRNGGSKEKKSSEQNHSCEQRLDSMPYGSDELFHCFNNAADEFQISPKNAQHKVVEECSQEKIPHTGPISLFSYLKDDTKNLHRAEILIGNAEQLQKNVFQFESLKTDKVLCLSAKSANVQTQEYIRYMNSNESDKKQEPSSQTIISNHSHEKDSTENSYQLGFFKNSSSDDDLRLDELNMDYEQIMKYFHELKESNA